MVPNRKRWLLRMALVGTAGLGLLAWALWAGAQGGVVVENVSGQRIDSLQINAGGHTSTFTNVSPGNKVTAPAGKEANGLLILEGQLADGGLIRWRGVLPEGARLVILPLGEIRVRMSGQK